MDLSKNMNYRTGEPSVDLVLAVIRQAIIDSKQGDKEATGWLIDPQGAELWLKTLGIGVTNVLRKKLKEIK